MNLPSDHLESHRSNSSRIFFQDQDFSIPELSRNHPESSSDGFERSLSRRCSSKGDLGEDRVTRELDKDGEEGEQGVEASRDGQQSQGENRQSDSGMHSTSSGIPQSNQQDGSKPSLAQTVKKTLRNHLSFIGPGIIASVAYADPGNWATDLQAGSEFGYKLLFIVLLSGLFAILLQVLCCRLGIVTGLDLARATRQLILGQSVDYKRQCPDGYPTTKSKYQKMDKKSWKWRSRLITLYSLYVVAEGAIIATELAELIGSALALNMLFPALPLWGGVLVTSFDVFLILFVYRPGSGIRAFELLIGFLVLVVLACFIALLVKVDPNWADVFDGYVPSSTIVGSKALYVSIGILGATVMPHGLFLGSHCALLTRIETRDEAEKDAESTVSSTRENVEESDQSSPQAAARLGKKNSHPDDDAAEIERQPDVDQGTSSQVNSPSEERDREREMPSNRPSRWINSLQRLISKSFPSIDMASVAPIGSSKLQTARGNVGNFVSSLGLSGGAIIPEIDYKPGSKFKRPQASLKHVRLHIPHASWDVALSLVFFAITINSAILIVAAAAFYYRSDSPGKEVVADLHDAFELLSDSLGKAFGILFAIALLAAGQSASITVTLAGQIISEGYINWKTNPFARRVITRVIALLPSLLVATIVGKDGLDTMLVASQVCLSMALPFVTFPLLVMTGSKLWMRVWEAKQEDRMVGGSGIALGQTNSSNQENSLHPLPSVQTQVESEQQSQDQRGQQIDLERSQTGILHLFHNRLPIAVLSWLIFAVIVIADGYVLITLFMGKE